MSIWIVIILVIVLVCALTFFGLLRAAANWGREAIELQQYGVETTGLVIEKRSYRRRGAQSTHIRYEYTDQFGKRRRSRRNLVTPEAWDAHAEGGPIAVVYSPRHPAISLPRYLLDLGGNESARGGPGRPHQAAP